MAEFMTGLKRSNYCGELRIEDCGKKVTVFGWVQRQRDLGQLIFIDLRDRTGIVQLALDDTTDKEIYLAENGGWHFNEKACDYAVRYLKGKDNKH